MNLDSVCGSNNVFPQQELADESIGLAEFGDSVGLANRLLVKKEPGSTGSKSVMMDLR